MELLKLTTAEFNRMAKLIYDRTGIHLPQSKLSLLSNRLRKRLLELQLETFQAYYELLRDETKCAQELPYFLSAVTTNETYFFRNENLWKFFREQWLPELVAHKGSNNKSIRIWSAASSSGEEAYTAAICVREGLSDFSSWSVKIIGTDISDRVLQIARDGEYNEYAVGKTSKTHLGKWFEQAGDKYVIKPELRKIVSFQFHNLRDPFPNGRFDLVFLRNVLMYFDTEMKLRVLENVTHALTPGGHLIVGDVDPIRNTPQLNEALKLDYCGPNTYRKSQRVAALAAGNAGS